MRFPNNRIFTILKRLPPDVRVRQRDGMKIALQQELILKSLDLLQRSKEQSMRRHFLGYGRNTPKVCGTEISITRG